MTYPTGGTSSPSRFNEGAVELAAMSWLDLSGWRVLPGDYLAPDGPMSARSDYRQTVLEGQLRDALATRDGLRLALDDRDEGGQNDQRRNRLVERRQTLFRPCRRLEEAIEPATKWPAGKRCRGHSHLSV